MLPAMLLFAACSGGDATAPDSSSGNPSESDPRFRQIPVTVSVSPNRVTVETNQLIQFLAHGRDSAGDSVGTHVEWSTSGGTILPDGRFSAAVTGTFRVLARSPQRRPERVDTAIVQVVRRQVKLASMEIAPGNTALAPGLSQTFLVTGYLKDGRAVPIGANWTATGGTIDAGGTYVAGDTAGTYHVIATHTVLPVADTAVVTISAPATPPPPPPSEPPADSTPNDSTPTPAPPPPAPTLAKLTLTPGTATLAPTTRRQFVALGQTATGDTITVDIVFSATGGTITSAGLYTAGSRAGSYVVIASSGGIADTSTITVTAPLGSGTSGIPFGAWAIWNADETMKANTELFTTSMGSINPGNIISRIDAARSRGKKLMLAMTGGHHPYLTDGVFDRAKWNAAMQLYNTAAIRDAVAKGVADGTIMGNSVMDEPQVRGLGDGNTWGPAGTMTKVRVDSLCRFVKAIFPTLPVGVVHNHDVFEPTKSYQACEFIVSQYDSYRGSVTAFRDGGLAIARRDGHAIAFSLNIMDGGAQAARDGLWNCPLTTTGGRGTYNPNCRMTAQQVREFGLVLGPAGCGLLMWRYDATFMARTDNIQAFKDVAAKLAATPSQPCRKG
jgi:hypothetical protein